MNGVAPSADAVSDRLHRFFRDGRTEKACDYALGLYLRGWSAAEICDGPLREVMRRIGELWHDGDIGVFAEHRATETCVSVINHLRGLVEPGDERPVALGGALEGDPFQIPSQMAAFVLAAEGYRSINTGPDTPLDALRAAVAEYKPLLVWLSVNVTPVSRSASSRIGAFAAELERSGIGLIVGGRGAGEGLIELASGVEVASSMRELAAFARGLRAARSS